MFGTREFKMIGLVALVGLAAGLFLASLTNFLANSNISGPWWSLKGNGSLWVPFGIGPVFLAMGWSGLVLYFRKAARWERWTGVTLGVGILIAAAGLLTLIFIRSSLGITLYSIFSFLPWFFAILAPVVWGILPVSKVEVERLKVVWYLGAGAAYVVALVVGFFVVGKVLS